MVDKVIEQRFSQIALMRAISSAFDNRVIITGSDDMKLISGTIPMSTLEEKARLLSGIHVMLASGTLSSSDILEQENMQLRDENFILREAIRKIEERLATIEASLPSEKVIILREISKEEARKEIIRLFSTGKTLYYSDIVQELRIDLELVVDICNELQGQGKIAIDAGVS